MANRNLAPGHVLKYEDLAFKSPGGGLEPYKFGEIIGKKIISEINEDDIISLNNLS